MVHMWGEVHSHQEQLDINFVLEFSMGVWKLQLGISIVQKKFYNFGLPSLGFPMAPIPHEGQIQWNFKNFQMEDPIYQTKIIKFSQFNTCS